jgi:hypothetical protein
MTSTESSTPTQPAAPAPVGMQTPPPMAPQLLSPYGYFPAPGIPAHQKTNGLAIASLILGILGIFGITAAISIGLGFGALGTVKRTKQPGKGLAIAGLVCSAAWTGLWIWAFVTS